MKDMFGTPINVGDTVAFNPKYYSGLVIGKIKKFTEHGIKVTYLSYKNVSTGRYEEHLIPQNQLVKKP